MKKKAAHVRRPVTKAASKKLPAMISGKGWKIANIHAHAECVLVITSEAFFNKINSWDSDVLPYQQRWQLKECGQAAISLSAVLGSHRYADLKEAEPAFAVAIGRVAGLRRAVIDKLVATDAPVPFALLAETLARYKGQPIVLHVHGAELAVTMVHATDVYEFGSRSVVVEYNVLHWMPGCNQLAWGIGRRSFHEYTEPQTISRLGIDTSLSTATRERLIARGRRACDLNATTAYVHLDSTMQQKLSWAWHDVAMARGRVVVDPTGHAMIDAHDSMSDLEGLPERDRTDAMLDHTTLTAAQALCVEPWLTVFSFSAKKWGRTSVDRVSLIKFRDDAFEKLVLPAADKRLVMALVQHTQAADVSDIIDGKGGGCSLLFHGEPGRGKTLTAEAVAEDLRRPLYAFGVGELGTDPQGLERKLHSVLQIAERWNAVLLLDEADVFLEARADGDVDRNAMVTTFLRLIEYYNGVLVLTTNRVRNIDKAFYSRLSLAIQFEDFTLESRQQVIRNLLSANGVTLSDDEIYALGEMGVNGRQIKKAIIGARSLARSEGRPGVISNADVTELLNRLRDFGADKDGAERGGPSCNWRGHVTDANGVQ